MTLNVLNTRVTVTQQGKNRQMFVLMLKQTTTIKVLNLKPTQKLFSSNSGMVTSEFYALPEILAQSNFKCGILSRQICAGV